MSTPGFPQWMHGGARVGRLEGQEADRGLRLGADLGLAGCVAAPRPDPEAADLVDAARELVEGARSGACSPRGRRRASANRSRWIDASRSAIPEATSPSATSSFVAVEARDEHGLAGGHVARAELDPHRHALDLPLGELVAGPMLVAVVEPDADAGARPGRRAAARRRRGPSRARRRCGEIGTITTWIGATAGGRRRPASSPWAMIVAPTIRVLKPHDVPQACSCTPSAFRKVTS